MVALKLLEAQLEQELFPHSKLKTDGQLVLFKKNILWLGFLLARGHDGNLKLLITGIGILLCLIEPMGQHISKIFACSRCARLKVRLKICNLLICVITC